MSEDHRKPKSAFFGKHFICLWTLPRDSKPIVRVEVKCGEISSGKLFQIGCNTIGLAEKSRSFFALFRGITFPTKKYEQDEVISLPCKAAISIQKWCFDLSAEIKWITTDADAFRLLAHQFKFDVENGKIQLTDEETDSLEPYFDEQFMCYKQYVETARKVTGYDAYTIKNVVVFKKVKLIKNILQKGSKINIVCAPKRLTILSNSVQVSIPWRKIRRFAEIEETKSISLEIFLADEQAFTWIELQCVQGTLLLQIIAEYITSVKERLEKPDFPQPKWVSQPKANKLSWAIFKQELFGGKKKKAFPKLHTFDEFECSSSEDEFEQDMLEVAKTDSNKKYTPDCPTSAAKLPTIVEDTDDTSIKLTTFPLNEETFANQDIDEML